MSSGQDNAIKVAIRFRGNESLSANDNNSWSFEGLNEVTSHLDDGKSEKFTFDHVLKEVEQEQMYNDAAKETVDQFFKGYNGTIFAYG